VKGPVDEDQLLEWVMEAGGENFTQQGDNYVVTTEPHDLAAVREALEKFGAKVLSAELTLVPQNVIEVDDESEAKKILRLMDAIDDHDDVQNVYANFDIPTRYCPLSRVRAGKAPAPRVSIEHMFVLGIDPGLTVAALGW